jgi:hypothetical protein
MGKFDAERHLKCRLASFFWSDANDFMWRIDLVQKTDMQHRSFRAKLFVDMLMASECSLKSIIFSMSPKTETAEAAYKLMRGCGHDLRSLSAEAAKRCKGRVAFLTPKQTAILQQAADLGVRTRYGVDIFFMLRHEDPKGSFFRTGKVTSTLEDHKWLNEFYRVVAAIFKASKAASKRVCEKRRGMLGTDIPAWSQRVKAFLHSSGIKP